MVMSMKYLIEFMVFLFYIPTGIGIYLEFKAGPLFAIQSK